MHGNMVFLTDFILPNRQQNGDLLACGVILHLHNWERYIFRLIVQPNHRERYRRISNRFQVFPKSQGSLQTFTGTEAPPFVLLE